MKQTCVKNLQWCRENSLLHLKGGILDRACWMDSSDFRCCLSPGRCCWFHETWSCHHGWCSSSCQCLLQCSLFLESRLHSCCRVLHICTVTSLILDYLGIQMVEASLVHKLQKRLATLAEWSKSLIIAPLEGFFNSIRWP